MKRIPIHSSNILSVGYDESLELLEIEFHDGRIYLYSNVPLPLYSQLMTASSHGKFFAREIRAKPHLYPYVRIL